MAPDLVNTVSQSTKPEQPAVQTEESTSLPAKRQVTQPAEEAPTKRDRPSPPAEPPVQVVLMNENAVVPKRGSANAAGFDLSAAESVVIPGKGKGCVSTALKVMIPQGCYGRVAPRSGLAMKNFIDVGAGVIDADYRGEVKVILFNFGEEDYQVVAGKRIAQLILEKISSADVLVVPELDETVRGENGFGSTGVSTSL